jgi:exopolysaccharide production protein ExoZ
MKKLYGLQYLRGLAATSVVIFHAASRSQIEFSIGEAGVDLFFILSGFLMVAITNQDSRPAPFLLDRFRRIVPIYWIASGIMTLAAMVGLFPKIKLSAYHVITSFLFVPSVSPSNGNAWPILVPGWTLNYEIMFYLIFAALMVIGAQSRQIIALTVIFLFASCVGWLTKSEDKIFQFYTNSIVMEFVIGCWIGFLWKNKDKWIPVVDIRVTVTIFMILAGLYVGYDHIGNDRLFLYGVPAAILIYVVLDLEHRGHIAEFKLPLLIGDASYSIYIWHTLAISMALKVTKTLALPDVATLLFCVITGLMAGLAGYYGVEKPVLGFFRERKYARRIIVPAAL